MTATKDELLELVDNEILAIKNSLDPQNTGPGNERMEKELQKAEQIRSILNLHFSISDEERAEITEYIQQQIERLVIFDRENPEEAQMLETILGALGEKVG